jgi:hypothetical protein
VLCPVCFTSVDTSIPVERDIDGKSKTFYFSRCGACDALFDQRVELVVELVNNEAQSHVNADFYRPSFSESKFDELIAVNQRMIAGFERFFRVRKIYVEIGVGLGFLTRAASQLFDRVYGLDLEVRTAESVGRIASNVAFREHQEFIETLSDGGDEISALCAWHVIEHFPDPHKVLRPLLRNISHRGVAFGQVPLFKPEYVYDAHFIFYNEKALIALFGAYGLFPVLLERDETNDFLTFCFRRA